LSPFSQAPIWVRVTSNFFANSFWTMPRVVLSCLILLGRAGSRPFIGLRRLF
jgi:hypothetical protein